jgi:ABC-type nitrate/sulfonate/bicarbonate transport system permease component
MDKRRIALIVEFVSPVVIIALWWVVTAFVLPITASTSSFFFPDPVAILASLVESFVGPGFLDYVLPTLWRFLVGFLIAALAGITVGTLLGVYTTARLAALPFVNLFRSLPGVTLIPIVTLFLGLGNEQKVTLIAIASVWPILMNAMDGARSLDLTIRESAMAYRVHGLDRYRFVIIPAATPQIFAGLRISISIALIVAVVSELFGASGLRGDAGIGYFLVNAQTSFDMPALWAGVILLGIIGYLINLIFNVIESKLLAWHRGSRDNALV